MSPDYYGCSTTEYTDKETLLHKLFFPTFFFKFFIIFISGNRSMHRKRSFIDQLHRVFCLFSLSSIMINTHTHIQISSSSRQKYCKKSIAIISGLRKSIILFCLLSEIAQKQKALIYPPSQKQTG